jgi:hypothetical protein
VTLADRGGEGACRRTTGSDSDRSQESDSIEPASGKQQAKRHAPRPFTLARGASSPGCPPQTMPQQTHFERHHCEVALVCRSYWLQPAETSCDSAASRAHVARLRAGGSRFSAAGSVPLQQ